MKTRFVYLGVPLAIGFGVFAAAYAAGVYAKPKTRKTAPEHWGIIARHTSGSAVAILRDGPFVSPFNLVDPEAAHPPYGRGSLGLGVSDNALSSSTPQEKVSFGNEVDFVGEEVLGLSAVGFHVFQTAENNAISPSNMPNITFEIDDPLDDDGGDLMVWAPEPALALNRWSGYLDATTTGGWYLRAPAGIATGCTVATPCDFGDLLAALFVADPIILSVAVTKGPDFAWVGAVDGLRINDKIYDFEAPPTGVREMAP